MKIKMVSKVAVLVAGGMVSACSSAGNMDSQGPWGRSSASRSYPEYSAPWRGRMAAWPYNIAVQPTYVVEETHRPAGKVYAVHLEPKLPLGHLPSRFSPEAVRDSESLPATSVELLISDHREAILPAQASAPGVFTPPQSASSYTGTWNASVDSTSCRIQLSSTPSLDRYKASAQGCSNDALKTVNGWSYRDNQVILFSRGQIVARLSGAEAALSGTLNGSTAGITMKR